MGKCIITYKGKKYSEEQFKEYFINNKQEFATSIAKNKDIIDSFKRKMEGIDFVFSQSPELASIGSKAQYLQYLSTIFKTSKVKDIVYHGSSEKRDNYKGEVIFFSSNKNWAGNFGKVIQASILNLKNPFDAAGLTVAYDDENGQFGFLDPRIIKKEKQEDGILGGFDLGQKEGSQYTAFEPEQIHTLSSKVDIQGFKNFMSFENSEFSKYGTYQQFRDFVTSKSSIEIENRLIETGKINRVC